ncbi:unnamed protein product [Angiostrongylus costaricensis]|uniref:Pkinase_fungal domain-containing protein n=1 Tax=Angiostrongylus costaricensis TaxID=334426 RepID=A0A0R3PA33_ANGCS|nr:unnamed protein product [Angiostrongylus costaricensis]
MSLQQYEPAECLFQVVVIGLSTGVVPKRVYLDDVERCRWIPWECLAGDDGVEPRPYDEKAVIWTLATMIWSMFHRVAAIMLDGKGKKTKYPLCTENDQESGATAVMNKTPSRLALKDNL